MGARNRFQDEWLDDTNLQAWLVKVTNDESRAYCRFCSIVLRAHKSDITNHGATIKHSTNAKTAEENGISTGPISVQIVCNDADNNEMIGNGQDHHQQSQVAGNELAIPAQRTLNVSPGKRSASSSSPAGSAKKQTKRYRVEWEDDPQLKDWIKPFRMDETKAFCRICETALRAHKHDLVLHAKSVKHTKLATSFDFDHADNTSDSFEDGEVHESGNNHAHVENLAMRQLKLESVDANLMASNNSNAQSEPTEDDRLDIAFDEDSQEDEEMNDKSPEHKNIKPLKKSKGSNESSSISRYVPRIRQTYINAADVVAAIENNEFTGYELLQIVKTAVPKL